jgi:hypothetical protein
MGKTYAQSDILTTLAYLLGERTVNATTSAPRADFIQQTLEEAYAAYPWRFARTNATLAISNSIATLPTNYDVSQPVHFKFSNGTEITLDEINYDDNEQVVSGDRAVWIYAVGDDSYVAKTRDTDVSSVIVHYQKKAPVLDSGGTIVTPYPNKMTIALGARRYVKLGQNPDADISQDEKIFQNKLSADIAFHQVPAPRKRRKTAQTQAGRYTGDF